MSEREGAAAVGHRPKKRIPQNESDGILGGNVEYKANSRERDFGRGNPDELWDDLHLGPKPWSKT